MKLFCKCVIILVSIGLLLTGCGPSDAQIKAKENEISMIAKQYLKEKYNMDKPVIKNASLVYHVSGPIPDFSTDVPRSGVVSCEYSGKAFNVVVSTGWEKLSHKFDNIVADNFQAEEIKNSIKENIIKKYAVTDEYFIKDFEASSLIYINDDLGFDWIYRYVFNPEYKGDMSYFSLKQKFKGDIEAFLKENEYSIKLNILFKGKEKDKGKYFEDSRNFFKKVANLFGNGESEISVHVFKEDKFMDSKVEKVFSDASQGAGIDPAIYRPAYCYCSVTGETHNSKYLEYVKMNDKKSTIKSVEMKENGYNFEQFDSGISAASLIENVEFLNKNDLKYNIKPITQDDVFSNADLKALDNSTDNSTDNRYEYGLLNKNIYNISYAKKEYNGSDVDDFERIAIEISKSIVPKGIDEIFLVRKLPNGDLYLENDSRLIVSGDSFIGDAYQNSDFVIAYRKMK